LGSLPLLAVPSAGDPSGRPDPPGAVVEVTAPMPVEPLVTVLDPRNPRQPVPAQDGAESLRVIPGFALVRKGGTGGEPVLRGMAGSRLGVLADGEETPGGCGGRMDPPTAYLFPEAYDQIRVVKGPQTVQHGPGSSAGTVLFQRTPPSWADAGWAAGGSWMAGGFGREDRILEVQGGNPRWYGRATGIRSRCGDYRTGAGTRIHSAYERWSLGGVLGWTPGARTRVELRGTRSDGQAAYADRGMDGVGFLRNNLGLACEARELSGLVDQVTFQASWNRVDHLMDNASLRPFTPSSGSPGPMARNPGRTTRGARVACTLRPDEASTWVLGADLRLDQHTVRRSLDQWTAPVQDQPRAEDAALDNAGLFGEWTRCFPRGGRLVCGLRADQWRARDLRLRLPLGGASGISNPTAMATRDQVLAGGFLRWEQELERTGTTVYVGLGHARRAPDYWELFPVEAAGGPSAFGTRPERTTQLDAGASWQLGGTRLSLSGFRSEVADYILIQSRFPKPGPAGGPASRPATIARNIGASSWGGELALAAAPAGPLRVDGSLAYTRGENRSDGLPLAQMPPLEARLGLAWEEASWSVGSLVRMVAPQNRFALDQGTIAGQDLGRTPGFAVLSLNASWRLRGFHRSRKPHPGLQLSCGVDNLFNRDYAEHISHNISAIQGYPGERARIGEPGRSLWVKIKLNLANPWPFK
jgi:iron complex outermembrane receptor protein